MTIPHLLLVTPYLWEGLSLQELSSTTIVYAQALPITEAERAYSTQNGADAFNDILMNSDPDIVDLWRESVV